MEAVENNLMAHWHLLAMLDFTLEAENSCETFILSENVRIKK